MSADEEGVIENGMVAAGLAEVAKGRNIDWKRQALPAAALAKILRECALTPLPHAITLYNADIAGELELDLIGQVAPLTLQFVGCHFSDRIRARHSRWRRLLITHALGSAIELEEIEIEKGLTIVDDQFSQHLDLRNAVIGGELALLRSCFVDTRQPAIALSGATLGRDLDMTDVSVKGAMIAKRLVVGGDAKFNGAAFRRADMDKDQSVVLSDSKIQGRIEFVPSSTERPFMAETRVELLGAHVGDLLARGARFLAKEGPALVCDQIVVDRTIDLSGAMPDGSMPFEACSEVRFNGARIGGQIQIINARFSAQDEALTLQGASIAGDVTLGVLGHKTTFSGALDLNAVSVGGRVVMAGLEVAGRPGGSHAIAVRQARISGDLSICEVRSVGAIHLDTSKVDGVRLQDVVIARLGPEPNLAGLPEAYSDPRNTLLDLHHTVARTDLHVERLHLEGGDFRILGAEIGGGIQLSQINIEGAAGHAMIAQGLRVRGGVNIAGTADRNSRFLGGVNFLSAEIEGGLTFVNVEIGSPNCRATYLLWRAKISGDIALHRTTVHGAINASGAKVRGDLRLESSDVFNPDGVAFDVGSAEFDGALAWTSARGRPCRIDGYVEADGATAGILKWDGLELAEGAKLHLTSMRIARAVQAESIIAEGKAWLDLTGTEAAALVDNLAENRDGWGAGKICLGLDGFSYARLQKPSGRQEDDPRTVRKWRQIWFDRRGDQRSSRPVRHLAAVLKRQGLYEAARCTLIDAFALESWARSPYGARQLSHHFGLFFGYGLSGWRAFSTLLILWGIGTAGVVSLQSHGLLVEVDGKSGAKPVACATKIDPGLYAADVMLPVVELGEEKKCEIGLAPGAQRQQPMARRDGYEIGEPIDLARLSGALFSVISWIAVSLAIATWSGLFKRGGREES